MLEGSWAELFGAQRTGKQFAGASFISSGPLNTIFEFSATCQRCDRGVTASTPPRKKSGNLKHIPPMPRSIKKSVAIPQVIRDGLLNQLRDRVIDYPSENAAWIGLARYQLLIGKPHPMTAPIARMHPDDQDLIDDFLGELAVRKLSLKGQFLTRLIREVVAGRDQPSEDEVAQLVPNQLLKWAQMWRQDPSRGIEALITPTSPQVGG